MDKGANTEFLKKFLDEALIRSNLREKLKREKGVLLHELWKRFCIQEGRESVSGEIGERSADLHG